MSRPKGAQPSQRCGRRGGVSFPFLPCAVTSRPASSSGARRIYADAWLENEPEALPTGHIFSAVRVAEDQAMAVFSKIRELGLSSLLGPVFADYDQVYFVVRPGTGTEPWPDIVRYCGHGCYVTVPPPQWRARDPAGLRWLISPRKAKCRFTDELVLRCALQAVASRLNAAAGRRAGATW